MTRATTAAHRFALTGATLALGLLLTSCTLDPVAVAPAAGQGASGSVSAPQASPSQAPADPDQPLTNDLATSPLKRSFKSGGLTFNVEYTASAPTSTWTPDGSKAIRVAMTVIDNRHPGRKMYLTRASLRFTVRNASDDLPAPDPIVDTANISPGYLATFPYSYEQSFTIPPLDASANAVILDYKFEVVSLVDQKSKDYTKQTATNSVQIALPF